MDKIFVIAWDFPPSANGESIVCNKTLKYSQHCYDLIRHIEPNESQNQEYPSHINVKGFDGGYLKWSKRVIKEFLFRDKSEKYKVIHSRTMPPMGHFIGFIIKILRPRIKWVIYFSDPLWNSPYILDMIRKYKKREFIKEIKKNPFFKAFYVGSFFAKIALKMSDVIVFNNEYLAEFVLGKRYKKLAKKVKIVPYGFDEANLMNIEEFNEIEKSEYINKKNVLAHVGHVYGNRNFNTIIEALVQLKENEPLLYDRLIIRQVGYLEEAQLENIKNMGVMDRFDIIGPVDYESSLRYMKSADYLLTIDAKFGEINHNIYIPSKIYDYLGSKKPIIAITQPKGPTADIIQYTNNELIEHDKNKMYQLLINIIQGIKISPIYERYGEYDCKYGSLILDEILDELLKA